MDKYNVNDNGTTLNNNGLIYKIISGCDINVASLIAKLLLLPRRRQCCLPKYITTTQHTEHAAHFVKCEPKDGLHRCDFA